MKPNITKLSKFLSYVLRHKPNTIELILDKNGWTDVTDLLNKMKRFGKDMDLELLRKVVETNNKKRFSFSEDGSKIRASQGHSIDIELNYRPVAPPDILYHGTAGRFLDSILKKGLLKGQRHHVHLSKDIDTASEVGLRKGKLIVLEVLSGRMHTEGKDFFVSENGVWLTDSAEVQYLVFPNK